MGAGGKEEKDTISPQKSNEVYGLSSDSEPRGS